MRILVVLSMVVLAAAEAKAEAATCVLQRPLKLTQPNMSHWEMLPAGTELTLLSSKSGWSRVQIGGQTYIGSTSQYTTACKANSTVAAAPVAAAPVAAAPVAAAPVAVVAAPVVAAAVAVAAPVVAPVAVAEAPAGKDVKAKTEPVSLAPSSTSPTPGQLFVLGLLLLGVVGAGVLLRRRTVVEQQHLAVVASRTLGRGKQLIVVDAGDSRLLLGVTEQGITLLSSTASHHHAPRTSQAPMPSPAFSLFTEEQEATMASKTGLLQDLGAKVGGLWGRSAPTPSAADWGDFDRILASTVPDMPNTDAPPTNHRRSAERKSTPVNGSGDLAELSRELQRHGARRSA